MSVRALAHSRSGAALVLAATLVLPLAGCSTPPEPTTTLTWVVGQSEPPFDPAGPADPVRWALERLLGEGLVAEDTTGRVVQAAARRWDVTPDGLAYTFHLRPGLRFADGRDCTSADFRRAIEAGLNRVDHATYAWLLSPIVGVDRARPGRPLPALGIATPDEHTLVLRLARPDPTLLHKLSLPGASTAWEAEGPNGGWGGGSGAYAVIARQPGRRMLLARRGPGEGPDTVRVEFAASAARARTLIRAGAVDLIWPAPPGMLEQPLPAAFRATVRPSRPARRLWLLMRGDLPPTRKVEARRALAHGLNRPAILSILGARATESGPWLTGGLGADLPRRDVGAVRDWLERGRLGRSMHVAMAYAADGAAAEVARAMQTEWAGVALDVELRPLRRVAMAAEGFRRGGAQLLLVESQAPLEDPIPELAMLVQPRTGPPVGSFRPGWATREFDRWLGPQPAQTPLDLELAERRLGEEMTVLPLARLPWLWVERLEGPRIAWHPRYGPMVARPASGGVPAHQSR